MASRYSTKRGRTSKRGAFLNSVWHCDCEPRLPADKFQTKNGGKNHGRWFYTCQQPQPKRCPFFLWMDEAKVREESAVLSNSRSEPVAQPQTPRKQAIPQQVPTPQTRRTPGVVAGETVVIDLGHDDSYDWSSSADEDLIAAADKAIVSAASPFATPRKAAKTETRTSPGKRTHAELEGDTPTGWPPTATLTLDDVFTTPLTSSKSKPSTGLPSPEFTPAQARSQPDGPLPAAEPSDLAKDALKVLEQVHLPGHVESELIDLLNRHDLRAQGVAKGRDIARVAIRTKDKKISELHARIQGLEAERETTRTVIAHLKQDILSTSPKAGKLSEGLSKKP